MAKSQDAFRTISEVADWLETPAHVLRFWESRFTQVKPVKRAGGRRYYRPADMELLSGIKKLLHEDGMTIKGVQKLLRAEGIKHVAAMGQALEELGLDGVPPPERSTEEILEGTREAARPSPDLEAPRAEPPIESQVISFPAPSENIAAESDDADAVEDTEAQPEVTEAQPEVTEAQPEAPLQASFLDDIPQDAPMSETPAASAEADAEKGGAPSTLDDVPALTTNDDMPEREAEHENEDAGLAPDLETTSPAPFETEAPPQDSPEDISNDTPLAAKYDSMVEGPDALPTEQSPPEGEAPNTHDMPPEITESEPSATEITSISQLDLPDAPEIPEVAGGYAAFETQALEGDDPTVPAPLYTPLETQSADLEGTADAGSIEVENADAGNVEPETTKDEVSETDVAEQEDAQHVNQSAPAPNAHAATDIPLTTPASDTDTRVEPSLQDEEIDGLHVETASHETVDALSEEPTPELEESAPLAKALDTPPTEAPEIETLDFAIKEAVAATLNSDKAPDLEGHLDPANEPEAVSEPEPLRESVAENDSAEPAVAGAAPLEQEVRPAVEESDPAQDPAVAPIPQDPNPEDASQSRAAAPDVAPSLRHHLTRRAAPFSPDKTSELAELTARLTALRKSYGTVSKPTLKN